MADIVIRNVNCLEDLVEATAHLFHRVGQGDVEMFRSGTLTLERGPWVPDDVDLEVMVGMDDDFDCIYTDIHSERCTCVSDARHTDPRQLVLLEATHSFGPKQYVPCPRQGTHSTLTECWMCWCDVDRGAITRKQALAAVTAA